MSSVISVEKLSKSFGTTHALKEVSFDVQPGRVVALLGANGAGKSTTIRVLMGLETPDSGQARIMNLDCERYSDEIRRRVGYVAEKPAMYEWMTVEEIGWFASGFYPPGYLESYRSLIRRFHVEPKKRISELSKGTRSKVALSLALAHSPDLLILDEPTSGLDPLVRREFLESMVDVAGAGRTVLLSSHQVNEVERVADDVLILLDGQIVCHESIETLKHDTREMLITLPDASHPLPEIPGTILARLQDGHEHTVIVRNLNEQQFQATSPEVPYELRHPSLEEILLALLRERRKEPKDSPFVAPAHSGWN